MVVSDCEDSLTKLNTELNRSMVLMDTNNKMEKSPKVKSKSRKSITIRTSSSIVSSTPAKSSEKRKSILKKTARIDGGQLPDDENPSEEAEQQLTEEIPAPPIIEKPKQLKRRPLTLDEYIRDDSLTIDTTPASFTINEIDEDDELWVFEIPKTINPRELKGQTLYFGDRSKFKIGNERYLAVSSDKTDCFTCVMGTGRETKRFKTVNIQPSGTIVVRKKLSNVGSHFVIDDDDEECNAIVPFPDNLKVRHPLMAVGNDGTKMKKLSPLKSRIKKRKSESSD